MKRMSQVVLFFFCVLMSFGLLRECAKDMPAARETAPHEHEEPGRRFTRADRVKDQEDMIVHLPSESGLEFVGIITDDGELHGEFHELNCPDDAESCWLAANRDE